ncbi:Sporulation lipoprotein YhcN/YlaJ (Spore_YhcN_YlaJ) [Lentibacillus halodurans]|uniref:Sporulation lipoprotein YhcN/YlaJ (Spore_YhcN_YlaJ) n=1 Tax=Lentibacillus halodurans TaxID=237679 RepID=A0A1I0UYB9_9BACI|nr:YhcN/YlaJ family sporulation lipoprotein [Lentibacillus halodurans]SFA69089.1 Sporulation lipoprotein YhcN/YlaJ (Spore_YhcN_YlaJ) [Lentibacillus halodurans]
MKINKWMIIPIFLFALVGCAEYKTGEQNTEDNMNSQPINYETEEEENERHGAENNNTNGQEGYRGNAQEKLNEGDENAQNDLFTNEMSQSISSHLKQHNDVRQAQVAVSEERVVVGVMLSDNAPPDMRELVEQEVQEMVTSKEVYVYTDDIYWDRMRNKDARLDQLNGDMREFLREFFNRDRENF